MSDGPDSERLSIAYPEATYAAERSTTLRFLTFLVFEGHGVRMVLELFVCVVAYIAVSVTVPWQALGISPQAGTSISWFGCCFLIIVLDQLILCRPVYAYRRSYQLGLVGAHEKALELLEQIGPGSDRLVRLPQSLYHLHRAEIFCAAAEHTKAANELQLAEFCRAGREQLAIARSRLYRAKGDFEGSKKELESALATLGATPTLCLERGLHQLEQRSELWQAKRYFAEVREMPEAAHFSGESTHQLATAYWHAVRLWTGEAEEGLEGLSSSINRFRSAIGYVDALRPVLSSLLVERALYYATHKEPALAVIDLRVALSLCTYPPITACAERIKEELQWRHQTTF